jgi:hypothetical protein
MWFPDSLRKSRGGRLLKAAGIVRRGGPDPRDEHEVCRFVAYRAARVDDERLEAVLGLTEELLADGDNYEFVLDLVENLQNVVSHGLPGYRTPDSVESLLGARSRACWSLLDGYWTTVATWRETVEPQLHPAADMLVIQNPALQAIRWTSERSLPTGRRIGLPDVIRYQKAGGESFPGVRPG